MRPGAVAIWLAVLLSFLAARPEPAAMQAGSCGFRLGFQALRDQIPAIVGDCLEDEHFNAQNGNAEQRTTGGLLVWRKADNWTAFTDGATTWINGPLGIQSRPNGGPPFAWEAAGQASGIEGQVFISPTCPGPQRIGEVCERPYPTRITVLDSQGAVLTTVDTDEAGRFRVPLPPGTYTLRPRTTGVPPRAGEQTVTVDAGRYTHVRIDYDSGIR